MTETHYSELNLNACQWGGDVSNDQGRLRCEAAVAGVEQAVTAPLIKPVAVEPLVKPVQIAPLPPEEPKEGDKKKKRRRDRG